MTERFRKTLSLLMALLICLSLFPVSVFAEEAAENEPDDVVIEESADPEICEEIVQDEADPAADTVQDVTERETPEPPVAAETETVEYRTDYPTIVPDNPIDVTLHGTQTPEYREDSVIYQFTPAVSGTYNLCVTQLQLPQGFDVRGTISKDGNSLPGFSFFAEWSPNHAISYDLEAGETYLVEIGASSEASFTLLLTDRPSENNLSVDYNYSNYRKVELNEAVTMSVNATAAYGSLSYIWEEVDDAGIRTRLDGETGSTLVIDHVVRACEYVCLVFDVFGNYQEPNFFFEIENGFEVWASGDSMHSTYKTVDVEPNDDVFLAVDARAVNGGLSYQWVDGNLKAFEGETTNSLTIRQVTTAQRAICQVQDIYGSRRSVCFSVCIENHFVAYPKGGTENSSEISVNVMPGKSAELEVIASADDNSLHYIWYERASGARIENDDSSRLTLQNPASDDCRDYCCYVRDDCGHEKDIRFHIVVDTGLTAREEKHDVPISIGESATMRVIASAGEGIAIHYQWIQVTYGEHGEYSEAEIPDATESSYTVSDISAAGRYRCRVTDDYGGTAWTYFEVWVRNHLKAYPKGYPNRTNLSIGVANMGSAVLEVVATSDDNAFEYQWYRTDSGPRPVQIENETGSSLTVTGIGERRYYSCHVSDRYGNMVPVSFEVYVENHLLAWCSNTGTTSETVYAEYGKPVVLQAEATSDAGEISYRWTEQYNSTTQTDSSFTTGPVTEYGYYQCLVSDSYGNTVYLEFAVRVNNHLSVTSSTAATQFVPYDGSAVFAVTATAAAGPIRYQWYGSRDVSGETGPSLNVDHIQRGERYSCTVSDSFGNSERITFMVCVENSFQAYVTGKGADASYAEVFVDKGESATLSVTATAATGGFTYAWYRYMGMNEGGYYGKALSETGPILVVENVQAAEQVECLVTDSYGTTKTVAFGVSVQNHLTAVDRETHLGLVTKTVGPGKTVTMTVDATADDMSGLNWSWFLQNEEGTQRIRNAEGNSYTTPALTEPRVYFCQVMDRYGFGRVVRYELTVSEQDLSAEFQTTLNMADFTGIFVYIGLPEGADASQYTVEAQGSSYRKPYTQAPVAVSGLPKGSGARANMVQFEALRAGSPEMTDEVTVILKRGNQLVKSESYSVYSVAQGMLANGGLTADQVNLVKGLLQYGYYGHTVFKNPLEFNPVIDGAPALVAIPSTYAAKDDPTNFGAYVTKFTEKLNLDSAIGMNLYLTLADGYSMNDFTYRVLDKDGNAYGSFSVEDKGNQQVSVSIGGIKSPQMARNFKLIVTLKSDPTKTATWTRSVWTCAYEGSARTSGTGLSFLQALYQYGLYAQRQFPNAA